MSRSFRRWTIWTLAMAAAGGGVAGFAYRTRAPEPARQKSAATDIAEKEGAEKKSPEKRAQISGQLTLWWDGIPAEIQKFRQETGSSSNIHRQDYAGPQTCQNCHQKQYESWSHHAHRWMNARADDSIVKGDFSDRRVPYLGGEVTCSKVDGTYRMRLERGEIVREYLIEQTIGSRFYQYYLGKQLRGPEPPEHLLYSELHVLPLGYWLDKQEWVPVVHVHDDDDDRLHDPYVPRRFSPEDRDFQTYAEKNLQESHDLYRAACNYCHTTFPVGEMFVRLRNVVGRFIPVQLDLSLPEFVKAERPELWPVGRDSQELSSDEYFRLLREFRYAEASEHAVTLGISCEACHLGAKEHASGNLKKPLFFPHAPELSIRAVHGPHETGRTHDNINWACGRCHTGDRPQYAAGMATWNSTEYSDAMRGSCYTQLTCIRCHDPHETLGAGWKATPVEDDAICLSCHQKFEPKEARFAHTHHKGESEGARCMNCHMPRINEGLQAVVRTHMIYSPTNRAMIEANHPNACNQCHVEQPIDWTLTHLKDWYGASFSEGKIVASYPERQRPASIGWLHGGNEAVRLVAADSLCRAKAKWAVPELLPILNDPFILNRQFTRMGLESMLNIQLRDYGYVYHMTAEERRKPLKKLWEELVVRGSKKVP